MRRAGRRNENKMRIARWLALPQSRNHERVKQTAFARARRAGQNQDPLIGFLQPIQHSDVHVVGTRVFSTAFLSVRTDEKIGRCESSGCGRVLLSAFNEAAFM